MPLAVHAIDHVVLNVRDVDASAKWYQVVLGVAREDFDHGDGTTRTALRFGRQKINLRPVDHDPVAWFTGAHPTAGSGDLCFLTTTSPVAVAAHLDALGVAIEEGQQRGRARSGRSFRCTVAIPTAFSSKSRPIRPDRRTSQQIWHDIEETT